MPILRNESRYRYTCINNNLIMCKTLTCKNFGLLARLLSLPDNWQFTEIGLSVILEADGLSSLRSGLKDLEKLGYLSRTRVRDEQGRLTDAEWTIRETPIPPEDSPAEKPKPACENPICENQILEPAILESRIQTNTNITRTNVSKTNITNNKKNIITESLPSFLPAATEKIAETEGLTDAEATIKENIEYEDLREESADGVLDDVVGVMVDIVSSRASTIRVNGAQLPASDVRRRFLTLGPDHVRYVIDTLTTSKNKIINARAYLITALYNAPTTMQAYYKAEANHDFSEGNF